MKKILFLTLIFSSGIFSFPDLNTFDKTKLIWKNPKIFYVHQYLLDVAFGRVNSYLCLINNTDYENNSNLEGFRFADKAKILKVHNDSLAMPYDYQYDIEFENGLIREKVSALELWPCKYDCV